MFETEAEFPSGVVLVAHGLNNKPEVMDSLIGVLLAEGFHCLRIGLHRDVGKHTAPAAIVNGWMDTLTHAHRKIVDEYGAYPIYSLGYSLGAVVTMRFLEVCPRATFRKMVLIAPPVALTRVASLVRFLTPLARFGIVLPSAAPREVRARWGTPLSEYAAMLELADALRTLHRKDKLRGIPTEIVLDPDDELVSYAGVLAWLERQQLEEWTAHRLQDRAPTGRTYAHLMVLEASLGSLAWANMTERVINHFKML